MANGSIIRKGPGDGPWDFLDVVEQRIIGKQKEEGGEGATLFDAAVDRYHGAYTPLERGADCDVGHQASDNPGYPEGHIDLVKDREKVVVVHAIEGFRRVDEKKKVLLLGVEIIIKGVSNLVDVIIPTTPADKAALTLVNNAIDGRHDLVGYDSSRYAVANVVTGDGAGSIDRGGVVLRKEPDFPHVEIAGGGCPWPFSILCCE